MLAGYYRLNDILSRLDRNKTTVLRWEKTGLIPAARRDSRGWRYYTAEEVEHILKLVSETNYFKEANGNGNNGYKGNNNNDVNGDDSYQGSGRNGGDDNNKNNNDSNVDENGDKQRYSEYGGNDTAASISKKSGPVNLVKMDILPLGKINPLSTFNISPFRHI